MNLFSSFNLEDLLFRIKLTSAILSGIFGFLLVYFIVQLQKLVGAKMETARSLLRSYEPAFGGASQSRWEEIRRHIDSEREAEWKLAVIEADKLIDNLLKSAGYSGDTMGDRLMNIEKGQLANLDELWEAHKIRNRIVHDVNYFLRYAEARRAVLIYEKILKELGGAGL